MKIIDDKIYEITAKEALIIYANGFFPMAPSGDTQFVQLYKPEQRGIFPLDQFHISKKLRKILRNKSVDIRINSDFESVVHQCAAREECWINPLLKKIYKDLHQAEHALSVELWDEDQIAGGLFGVYIGGVFCGESMFSTQTNASKIALVHLVARLIASGFSLLDTQYVNPHLEQFGNIWVSNEIYDSHLANAIGEKTKMDLFYEELSGQGCLDIIDTHRRKSLVL